MARMGIVFSDGTLEENETRANAIDQHVFPVLVPDPGPGTIGYEGAIVHPDGVQCAYPTDDRSGPLLTELRIGPIVDLDALGFYPVPLVP